MFTVFVIALIETSWPVVCFSFASFLAHEFLEAARFVTQAYHCGLSVLIQHVPEVFTG